MIAIVNINSEKFTFNGIPYYKNFMGIVAGEYVHIVNVYDSKIALTKDGPVKYDEITVNGNSYASAALLQNALLPVLYTRNTLGGSGGGSVGSINDVLNNGQEVTDQRAIIYPDNGISSTRIENGEVYFENNGSDYSISFFVGGLRIQSISNSSHFTELYFETPTANNAWMIPNESGTAASRAYVELLIDQLINGAPVDANTLKELNDKIVALQAIVGGTAPDGNSIVDTVAELLAVFSSYPEGTDIATVLAGKVNVADVVNDLNQLVAGKVLDARQGKALADLITAKWTAVDATGILKGIMKLYTASGSNTDGTMTQKAITDLLDLKANLSNTLRFLKSFFTGNSVTTTETVVGFHQVGGPGTPASFSLKCFLRAGKTNTTSVGNLKFYLSTTPDLTGTITQIAFNSATSALVIPLERTFIYSGGNLYGWNATNGAPTDVANSTVAESITAVDMTTVRYLVATLQTTGTAGSTLNGRDFEVILKPNVT